MVSTVFFVSSDIPVRGGSDSFSKFCDKVGNAGTVNDQNMYEEYKYNLESLKQAYGDNLPSLVPIHNIYIPRATPALREGQAGAQATPPVTATRLSTGPRFQSNPNRERLTLSRPAMVFGLHGQMGPLGVAQAYGVPKPKHRSMAETSNTDTMFHPHSLPRNPIGSVVTQWSWSPNLESEPISALMQELLEGSEEDWTSHTSESAVGDGRPSGAMENLQGMDYKI